MSASSAANIIISEDTVSEQEETRKAARMTLKEVQNVVSALKENQHPFKPASHGPGKDLPVKQQQQHQQQHPSEPKRCKMVEQLSKATQTTFEAEQDLTAARPSINYWEKLAESRRISLKEALDENALLHMEVGTIKEELGVAQSMIESLKSLVDTLMEMLDESESKDKPGTSGTAAGAGKEDDSGLAHSLAGYGTEEHDEPA
uniref:Geminin n=1 Tax=Anopheles melas TaxID=34690 RepID=A0A182UEY3_9DIPT